MTGQKRIIASLVLAVAGVALGQETPEAIAPTRSPLETLRAAQQAFAAESYAEALEHYEALRSTMPDTPDVPYNMGVAAYRAGDLERAAEYFDEALALANDPEMLARSAYNLGTTAYARTLEPPEPSPGPSMPDPTAPNAAAPGDQLDRAAEALGEALGHFRRALDVDASDEDARANAELAQRLLQRIEEMKEQQQQQQGEPQEGEQQDGEPQEGSASTDRTESGEQDEQQQAQGEDQGQPESAPPTEGEEQEQQEAEQPEQAPGEEPEQATPAPQEGEEPDDEETGEGGSAGEQDRQLTRDEAERLLQSVRDKERERRERLERQRATNRRRVEKDW
ncbi:MAG: tetratricopeptide repeat protein [Planctomycetes bacterium]|nr:tetratricopeptide repeat protein [Planctomycetota bacterium]